MTTRSLPEGIPTHPAVDELLDRAHSLDIGGSLATIAEMCGLEGDATKLMVGGLRSLEVEEVWGAFQDADQLRDNRDDLDDRLDKSRLRLERQAYLLFWESRLVQRWITGFVQIAAGELLDPMRDDPFGKRAPDSQEVWQRTRKKASVLTEPLGELVDFINARYNTQVRNAISHSQCWTTPGYIVLNNHRHWVEEDRPSISREEWEEWYADVHAFAFALVNQTRAMQQQYAGEWTGFEFQLDGNVEAAHIGTDDRGWWTLNKPAG